MASTAMWVRASRGCVWIGSAQKRECYLWQFHRVTSRLCMLARTGWVWPSRMTVVTRGSNPAGICAIAQCMTLLSPPSTPNRSTWPQTGAYSSPQTLEQLGCSWRGLPRVDASTPLPSGSRLLELADRCRLARAHVRPPCMWAFSTVQPIAASMAVETGCRSRKGWGT